MLLLYLSLFISFFLTGLLAFGGAPVLPAFIGNIFISQHEWFSSSQVSNLIALSMITPGDLALNAATVGGYATTASTLTTGYSILGSFIATLGVTLPSFVSTSLFCRFKGLLQELGITQTVISWLKPVIPGIALSGAILLMIPDAKGGETMSNWELGISIFLFISTIIGSAKFNFSPIFMLSLCGIAGWILF